MFELSDLTLGYGHGDGLSVVVREMNLTIDTGETVALVGPSGGGKSTLLRALTGILKPLNGSIRRAADTSLWYSPQQPQLIEFRSALENVCVSREFRTQLDSADVIAARDLLAQMGLDASRNRRPRSLSGGMRRRVALAQALFSASDILILDEPFAELDIVSRKRAELVFEAACGGRQRTVVMATHDIDSAIAIADRLIVMAYGNRHISRQLRTTDLFQAAERPGYWRRSTPLFAEAVGAAQRFIVQATEEAM